MKLTEYEAKVIQPLIENSPLLSWGYRVWTVRQYTSIIGTVEFLFATLIALRHWSAKASAIGSAGAVLMFLTTLSLLFSTPGWEPTLGGFPALSGSVGEFLIKDVVLLGAALWSLSDALEAFGKVANPIRNRLSQKSKKANWQLSEHAHGRVHSFHHPKGVLNAFQRQSSNRDGCQFGYWQGNGKAST
jgi:hypothetical protein